MVFPLKKKIIVSILIFSFAVSPMALFLSPNKAYALVVPVRDFANLLVNRTTATGVTTLVKKEYVADTSAHWLAQLAIDLIVNELINWINSGFDGGPTFITDFGGFLTDIAWEQALVMTSTGEGSPLELLCPPGSLGIKIRAALSIPSSDFRSDVACTFDEAWGNMRDFINGDFTQGGLQGFFEISTRSNPYRNYLAATAELDARIAGLQYAETVKINWGSGFLSHEDEDGNIVTPGTLIENQIGNALGTDIRSLELADEFSEIIVALVGALIGKIFNSGGGLYGTTGGSGVGQAPGTVGVTPPSSTCTDFTYSEWDTSACSDTGVKTRTIVSRTPPECIGGNPEPLVGICSAGGVTPPPTSPPTGGTSGLTPPTYEQLERVLNDNGFSHIVAVAIAKAGGERNLGQLIVEFQGLFESLCYDGRRADNMFLGRISIEDLLGDPPLLVSQCGGGFRR